MSVYQGPDSCYAKREGIYVKRIRKPGVDTVAEAAALTKMVLRDYRRGWTYDDNRGCRKIRMSERLFVRRMNFILYLANVHGASDRAMKKIEEIVEYAIKNKKLKPGYGRLANRMIVRKKRKR